MVKRSILLTLAVFSSTALFATFDPNINGGVTVVLDGETVTLETGVALELGSTSSGNTLKLENGAKLTIGGSHLDGKIKFSYLGYDDNHISITGGSVLTANGFLTAKKGGVGTIDISGVGSMLHLTVGSFASGQVKFSHATQILVSGGGLLKLDSNNQAPGANPYYTADIRLDGGFYAVKTANDLTLNGGKHPWGAELFSYFNGSDWQAIANMDEFNTHYSVVHYENSELGEQAAYNDTGIWGLGGYSVVSNLVVVVPEPATYAAICSTVMIGFVVVRRRRKNL